jgi:hypothetical protein
VPQTTASPLAPVVVCYLVIGNGQNVVELRYNPQDIFSVSCSLISFCINNNNNNNNNNIYENSSNIPGVQGTWQS